MNPSLAPLGGKQFQLVTLQLVQQGINQLLARHRHHLVHLLAAIKQDHRRQNAGNTVALDDIAAAVDINSHNLHIRMLLADLLHDRQIGFTRRTPVGIKIGQHGLIRLQHLLLKMLTADRREAAKACRPLNRLPRAGRNACNCDGFQHMMNRQMLSAAHDLHLYPVARQFCP